MPQMYMQTKAYKNALRNTGLKHEKNPISMMEAPQADDSLPVVNQLGGDSLRVNDKHFATPTPLSRRARSSLLMAATNNAMMSITMDPTTTKEETVTKKAKINKQQRMIKM